MANNNAPKKGQKTKYGSMAIAFTAIFLVAAVLVNVLGVLLTDRLGLRWDITDNRLYTISDTTVELLETLPEDIKVTVLSTEYAYQNTSTYRPIREVLTRYEQLSGGKLTVRYVDPYANPDIVSQYSEISTPNEADIIIESSKRYKAITPSDLYDIRIDYSEGTQQQGLQAEQKFSSAIMYCLADELPKAIRTSGHDEDDLSGLNSLLTTANYSLDRLNLAINEIPDDCALLIITNPKSDFQDVEIERLEQYLDGDGSVIVFYDTTIGRHLTKFELFMEDWGVAPQDTLVCDSEWAYTSPVAVIPALDSTHELTSSINRNTGDYVVSTYSRAWSTVWGASGTVKGFRRATSLLTTTATSYGKSTASGQNISTFSKQDGDTNGPFYIGVLSEQNNPNTGSKSNILFLSSGVASDAVLENDMFLNRRLMISAINFMNEDSDAIIVEARYAQSTSLTITKADANFIFWTMCVAIPVGVLVAGGVVWFRRKNR